MWVRILAAMCIIAAASANVIGLDFGSDSMKVAIVQPGAPLEIGALFPYRNFPNFLTLFLSLHDSHQFSVKAENTNQYFILQKRAIIRI